MFSVEAVSTFYLIMFLILLGLAIIPAKIAQNKGYGFWPFYLFGVCLWIPALIVALVMQDKNESHPTGSMAQSNELRKADELLKYKQLLDAEVITPEEFEQIKDKLLNHSDGSSGTKHQSIQIKPGSWENRATIQSLSVAAIVAGAVNLVLMSGMALLFMPPIIEWNLPLIPAFSQAAFLSALAGALLLCALKMKNGNIGFVGTISAAIGLAFWAVGFLGALYFSIQYEMSVVALLIDSIGAFLYQLVVITAVACATLASLLVVKNGQKLGVEIRHVDSLARVSSIIRKRKKPFIVAACTVVTVLVVLFVFVIPTITTNQLIEETNESLSPYLKMLGKEEGYESSTLEDESAYAVSLMGDTGSINYLSEYYTDTIYAMSWETTCYEDELPRDYLKRLNSYFGSEAKSWTDTGVFSHECYSWEGANGFAGVVAYFDAYEYSLWVRWYVDINDYEEFFENNDLVEA